MCASSADRGLPSHFIKRRMHSLLGVWLSIFLMEHLFTNSQAALYFQDGGGSFIQMVNRIHDLPFLIVIEILFLAFPFILHAFWGIYYLKTAKQNSFVLSKNEVSLPHFKRNRAYTWQRVTAIILVPAILLHVYHMRFRIYPEEKDEGNSKRYIVRVYEDRALAQVVSHLKGEILSREPKAQVLTALPSFGAATYLNVRETFKSPALVIFYSIFVIAASYHGFNGLWTFFVSWGVTISRRAQRWAKIATNVFMLTVMALGLFSVWGTYWTFLFQT